MVIKPNVELHSCSCSVVVLVRISVFYSTSVHSLALFVHLCHLPRDTLLHINMFSSIEHEGHFDDVYTQFVCSKSIVYRYIYIYI